MLRHPPPTHLEPLDVRRHLCKPVFSDRKLMRVALKKVRKATSASTQFLPEYGMTVGEFCVCRLITKWGITDAREAALVEEGKVAQDKRETEGDGDV